MTDASPTDRCPCGLGSPYERCCGRLHRGDADALTAEQLMRARFSGFARKQEAFLLRSWHPTTRPDHVRFDDREWTTLEVHATNRGGPFDEDGQVEFTAHHRRDGRKGALHELSQFGRDDGRWVYVGPLDLTIT